ncbi:MAG: hypothetical protein R3E08_01575 [Thiotrichaceae bacterium]
MQHCQWMLTQQFAEQQIVVAMPLMVIFAYKMVNGENRCHLQNVSGQFNRNFESVINYLANTLSFLRVVA